MKSLSSLTSLTLLLAVAAAGATCGATEATHLPQPESKRLDMLGPGDVIEVRLYNEPELSDELAAAAKNYGFIRNQTFLLASFAY